MSTLKVCIPDYCVSELRYSLDILLGEFLGLTFQTEVTASELITITQSGSEKELILDSSFFQQAFSAWLKPQSMPQLPLQYWTPSEDDIVATLVEPSLPVLYGKPGIIKTEKSLTLNVDIFGIAFFMLSRYEELVILERDIHHRFPATASVAFSENFLERPLVDEYVEILWNCLIELWPGLVRKERVAINSITCDVDWPFDPAIYSLKPAIRKMARLLFKEYKLNLTFQTAFSFVRYKLGFEVKDRYREAISWIMDVNEKVGNRVAFYFITHSISELDSSEDFNSDRMRLLLREIVARGHEIGIHPGYETYRDANNFSNSINAFKKFMKEENIKQEYIGGRQHFLRWDMSKTPHLWEENGLDYDSSLAYAETVGFRCGTCHDYNLYDLINRKKFKLKQRPLAVMECSIISKTYEGLGYSEAAFSRFKKIKLITRSYNGRFTLLWHNSHFENRLDKEFYMELIK
ncbi:MAG: polysaccharide deacetylase family protein [Vibrio ordalii]|uniref:polysaccharide deacetylase family protein n=1 Tax=Vibrio TaxID=662 RepID=UPI003D2FC112